MLHMYNTLLCLMERLRSRVIMPLRRAEQRTYMAELESAREYVSLSLSLSLSFSLAYVCTSAPHDLVMSTVHAFATYHAPYPCVQFQFPAVSQLQLPLHFLRPVVVVVVA